MSDYSIRVEKVRRYNLMNLKSYEMQIITACIAVAPTTKVQNQLKAAGISKETIENFIDGLWDDLTDHLLDNGDGI